MAKSGGFASVQKRCGEDRVCGVLRFQARLACRVSSGVSGSRQHAWRGEKMQAVTNTAGCLHQELSPGGCKASEQALQPKPMGGGEASTQAAWSHRDVRERDDPLHMGPHSERGLLPVQETPAGTETAARSWKPTFIEHLL